MTPEFFDQTWQIVSWVVAGWLSFNALFVGWILFEWFKSFGHQDSIEFYFEGGMSSQSVVLGATKDGRHLRRIK